MKILNEKLINKQSFIYELLNSKRVELEEGLKEFIGRVDDITFKIMNNNFDLVMQFPKNESRVLRYGSYYIGINFKSVEGETLFIRYVVDDEELSKQDFNKLTGIINTLYDKFKDYDVEKFNKILELSN
jgi:hypothetical protein|nr:MAG TPA: hypothetical protein [Herelleviridae sp.]